MFLLLLLFMLFPSQAHNKSLPDMCQKDRDRMTIVYNSAIIRFLPTIVQFVMCVQLLLCVCVFFGLHFYWNKPRANYSLQPFSCIVFFFNSLFFPRLGNTIFFPFLDSNRIFTIIFIYKRWKTDVLWSEMYYGANTFYY